MRNSEIILRFTREFMCKIWCPSFPPSPPHSFSFPWFSSSLSIYFNSPKLCPSSLKTQCTWGVLSKIWQICLIWPVHALEQKALSTESLFNPIFLLPNFDFIPIYACFWFFWLQGVVFIFCQGFSCYLWTGCAHRSYSTFTIMPGETAHIPGYSLWGTHSALNEDNKCI